MVTGIALVAVARALDALLDGVMTAQARILAHLVAAGQEAAGLIATIDAVAAATVLDEVRRPTCSTRCSEASTATTS